MSKRSADNDNLPQGKRRLTEFNPEWGSDFPFVLYTEDASGGMFCSAVVLLRRSSKEALCKLFAKSRVHKTLLCLAHLSVCIGADLARNCPYNNTHITLH